MTFNLSIHFREAEYYRRGKEDGAKKEISSLIAKQFTMRRGSSGCDEAPQITPEEIEAIKKSRLTAAESTSIKIAGLKITVCQIDVNADHQFLETNL